jgi:uncharacterized cupredoxin-like copper-binding protein
MKILTALKFFAVLPLFVACSNAPARDAVETTAPASPAHATQLIVEAKEFAYSPDQVTVKAGQPVEIVLKNMGVTTHDFTIEKIALKEKAVAEGDEHDMGGMGNMSMGSMGSMSNTSGMGNMGMMNGMGAVNPDQLPVHVAAAQGDEGTVTFTPTEAGTYEFYCTVAGHKASGMVGKLIVVGP